MLSRAKPSYNSARALRWDADSDGGRLGPPSRIRLGHADSDSVPGPRAGLQSPAVDPPGPWAAGAWALCSLPPSCRPATKAGQSFAATEPATWSESRITSCCDTHIDPHYSAPIPTLPTSPTAACNAWWEDDAQLMRRKSDPLFWRPKKARKLPWIDCTRKKCKAWYMVSCENNTKTQRHFLSENFSLKIFSLKIQENIYLDLYLHL